MDRVLQIASFPHFGIPQFVAAPAQFGMQFEDEGVQVWNIHSELGIFLFVFKVVAELAVADPLKACSPLQNMQELHGRIAVVQRGSCMFEEKARLVQNAGALGIVVIGGFLHLSNFSYCNIHSPIRQSARNNRRNCTLFCDEFINEHFRRRGWWRRRRKRDWKSKINYHFK